jgi:hypothetical protein
VPLCRGNEIDIDVSSADVLQSKAALRGLLPARMVGVFVVRRQRLVEGVARNLITLTPRAVEDAELFRYPRRLARVSIGKP